MDTPTPKQAKASSSQPHPTKRSRVSLATFNRRPPSMDSDPPFPRRRGSGSRARHKGKGKEAEGSRPRGRDRDAIGFGVDYDDDGSDGEIGVGGLPHGFTSASSALQGLLRKLGAGLDDFLPSSGSSSSQPGGRFKKMLVELRADGEEGRQVEALTQLCDLLAVGTEDSLGSFPVDSFVPVLVGLLNHESNPDIMLLAARAMTHLCDVLPSSCSSVVHYGAVSCFVARLLTIEYMDLAEQSLQALKKISQEHPTACLRAGALMAVLSYLDFFSMGVQRVALSTAENICKKLPSDAADSVMQAVPLLTNLLNYHDSKVLDHASVCLTRIAEGFASSPEILDELCNHGLVAQAAGLISASNSGGGQASVSMATYTGLIRLLSTCASGSTLGAKALHLLGISRILTAILSGSNIVAGASVSPAMTRPPEQIFEIVNLADELLPPLPPGTISLPVVLSGYVHSSAAKKFSVITAESLENADGTKYVISAREKLLHDQPELLHQFGMDLLPVLVQIYESSINAPVRHKCLSVIAKVTHFSTGDTIQSLHNTTNISSFLASLLAWKDPQVLIPALQIAEILMDKLPGTFAKMFVREGVVHAIDMLIVTDRSVVSSPFQSSYSEKDNDFLIGSSRSRRYRRRSGLTVAGCSSPEQSKISVQGNIGPSSTTIEVSKSKHNLRTAVSECAKALKNKYFPSNSDSIEVGMSDDLIHLKTLSAQLNASIEDVRLKGKFKAPGGPSFGRSTDTKNLNGVISEILTQLSKVDSVSTFEFIGSGVVSALLNYFSCGAFSKDRASDANLYKFRYEILRRFKSFIAIALPATHKQNSELPMTVLVQKLQSALSSLERFPVVLSQPSRSSMGSSHLSSGLGALTHPIKLCLCRSRCDKSLRDYSSNIVLIDPLATLAFVEEFLWPRVQFGDFEKKSSTSVENSEHEALPAGKGPSLSASTIAASDPNCSPRSRSSLVLGDRGGNQSKEGTGNVFKGKGKSTLKNAAYEYTKKTQIKSDKLHTKAVSDKNTHLEPIDGHGHYTSEDEELDMSSFEIADALLIGDDVLSEEDDVLIDDSVPICIPDKVDVKLGDTSDDGVAAASLSSNPTHTMTTNEIVYPDFDDFTSLNSTGSRGTLSFAAATMASVASGSGKTKSGDRGHEKHPYTGRSNDPPKLIFSSGGKTLNRHLTLYQAIKRQNVFEDDDHNERANRSDFTHSDGARLWGDIYTITYRKAGGQLVPGSTGESTSSPLTRSAGPVSASSNSSAAVQKQQVSFVDSILHVDLPCDLEKSDSTYNILALLRVLEGINQLAPRLRIQCISDDFIEGKQFYLNEFNTVGAKVPSAEFINNKLTPKLARQVQDVLALFSGSLPTWCSQLTKACPFLFPLETRRQFFYSTTFGLSRALHHLHQFGIGGHGSSNERESRVDRLQRQKVRVSRNRILASAAKVMEMYSSQKALLEVEYFGEVGTGLGPTLEFYTLLSHEFQKDGLQMWRSNVLSSSRKPKTQDEQGEPPKNDTSQRNKIGCGSLDGTEDMIYYPLGLFPRPWPPSLDSCDGKKYTKVVDNFRLLGRVIAKALQDGRLLDLPLSVGFYKLILGHELDLYDILSFDTDFGKTLQEMQLLAERKKHLEALGQSNLKTVADLHFRGTPIEDLCLDFAVPGYPDYILKQENVLVDIDNLEEYISLVVDATVKSGIARQLEAFREGFNQVFDIASLKIFSADELDYLLCGRSELWKAETLIDHIKFDHGYTAKSPAIIYLLEILGEFTPEQQRAFCQFVTGAPRLPPGGLAVLNPKLTIVRKHSSTATNTASNGTAACDVADDDLPSVMTCANYLKLPPYSTKEIMKKKVLYAISEGQGSFDLS